MGRDRRWPGSALVGALTVALVAWLGVTGAQAGPTSPITINWATFAGANNTFTVDGAYGGAANLTDFAVQLPADFVSGTLTYGGTTSTCIPRNGGSMPTLDCSGISIPQGTSFLLKATTNGSTSATSSYYFAEDQSANTFSGTFPLSQCQAFTFSPSPGPLPNATVGNAYTQTITASDGTSPYSYVLTAGNLAGGTTLNHSTGVISGTPTASGTFAFTVTATDANHCTGDGDYSLKVAQPSSSGGPDLAVELRAPAQLEPASRLLKFTVTVKNTGTAPSDPTRLKAGQDPVTAAGQDYALFQGSGEPTNTVFESVPGLNPGASWTHTFALECLGFCGSFFGFEPLGPIDLQASIPPDKDGQDGSDQSTGVTQVRFAGEIRPNAVCASGKAGDLAGLAAASCPPSSVNGFSGRAKGQVTAVQIAVERIGHGARAARASTPCSELVNANGKFRRVAATHGRCERLKWLNAHGTKHWTFRLHHTLPAGKYVLYVRPVTPVGTPVSGFSVKAHNAEPFTLR